MRILQVVHDFLPRHVAGVEVYTDHLCRGLARDHDVALLFSEAVPDAENYSLRRGRHGDVATYEIVNNHVFQSFEETYRNPAVDARVREVLDEFRPDVAHVQHLINLSLGVLDELRRRAIPTLMTLHEHWLACANGGQRFHRDAGRCDTLDAQRCGSCNAHLLGDVPRARGLLGRLLPVLAGAREGSDSLRLTRVEPLEVDTPDPRFVYRDSYALHGVAREAWVAHPPARLAFRVAAGEGAVFRAHVAMHPATFETCGGAVLFSVWVDGVRRAEVRLDPRRNPEDRYPRGLAIPLAPGAARIELRTASEPPGASEFSTAAWIDARVEGVLRPLRERVANTARRIVGGGGPVDPARRIERRWQSVREVASAVDLFLLPSRYLQGEMVRFGLPAERMVHCDYGFPSEAFPRREALPEVARHFAFLGSVMRHKGMHVLLEAFEGLPTDARLSVGGSLGYDPTYAAWLQQMARHPGVRFVGGVSPDCVPGFLGQVDALVVPSIWNENSPLTIHEAFLAGVPVVASRIGGSTELLEAGGGLLYEADDPQALRAQLRRLYDEPGLARQLAASAPRVKSMKEHVVELVELYDRARCGRRGTSDRA